VVARGLRVTYSGFPNQGLSKHVLLIMVRKTHAICFDVIYLGKVETREKTERIMECISNLSPLPFFYETDAIQFLKGSCEIKWINWQKNLEYDHFSLTKHMVYGKVWLEYDFA
jgi:hypothetical protein